MDNSDKSGVNVTSIAELKAELYRKQSEFRKEKQGHVKAARPTPVNKKPSIWSKQNAGVLQRAQNDLIAKQEEDDVMGRSRAALEAKAKLYAEMSSGKTVPDEDGSSGFLVDFQKKAIDVILEKREEKRRKEVEERKREQEEKEAEEDRNALKEKVPKPSSSSEEWVDYIDSFGRSRRCMRKDLPKDARSEANRGNTAETATSLTHVSADMLREMQRQKWQEEEMAALEKPAGTIHYADVQFNEVRTHGVGFYQFSKDEQERQEQLKSLSQLREQTVDQRNKREKLKEKRKAVMEARLAKVKQRKFLREGGNLEDFKLENKDSEDESDASTQTKQQEPEPLKRDETLKLNAPVREWDIGKKVIDSDQWLTKQRELREEEFAPPQFYYEDKLMHNNKNMHKKIHPYAKKQLMNPKHQDNDVKVEETNTASVSSCRLGVENVADIPLPSVVSESSLSHVQQLANGPELRYEAVDISADNSNTCAWSQAQPQQASAVTHQLPASSSIEHKNTASATTAGEREHTAAVSVVDQTSSQQPQHKQIFTDHHEDQSVSLSNSQSVKSEKEKMPAPLPVHYSKPAMPCQPKKYQAPFVPVHSVPESLPELPPQDAAKDGTHENSYAEWYNRFNQRYKHDFEPHRAACEGSIKSANIPFVSPYVVQKSETSSEEFNFLPVNPSVPPPNFTQSNKAQETASVSTPVSSASISHSDTFDRNLHPQSAQQNIRSVEKSIAATLKSLRSESKNLIIDK